LTVLARSVRSRAHAQQRHYKHVTMARYDDFCCGS